MGRPRKNPLPTKVQEKALDTMVAEGEKLGLYESTPDREPVKPVECNNLALSILRNPVNQRWMLVSIKFDYKTKTYGTMSVIEEHTDRIEIVHRYQVISGTEFMSAI